ncbi:MAG: hypothetical protein GY861_22825 [bacterium]|nr:hypothetical protein [bacterium]
MINLNPDLREILNMIGGNANQDIGYSSGQRYAQSIAGGQNVPDMIAPGVSYSMERPEGYTQSRFYNAGPAPVMPSAPTQGNPLTIDNQMPYAPAGVTQPERYTPMITNAESLKNLSDLFNANMPSGTQVSFDPFIDGEPMAIDDLMPSVTSSPIDFSFNPFEEIAPAVEPMVEDLPSVGSSPIDFSFNPFIDNLPYAPTEIDPIPQPVDVPVDPMPSYFVPETPVVSLQDNPTGPVDMPAEVFEDRMEDIMDYDDLQDIVRNKDFLTQIPAEDGVRNQYQVELDNYINESENKKETYLDTFPIGGAFNLGIPNIFENVVAPAVIPGLGIVKEAAQSFNPSPSPSPSPSFTAPSSGGRFYNDNTRFLLR